MKEPELPQFELFRKALPTHSWQCFEFNQDPISHQTTAPIEIIEKDASDASSSSSSVEATKPISTTDLGPPEEFLLGSTTMIQHSMTPVSDSAFPHFEGKHWKAACGAMLHTDRCQFTDAPASDKLLCQRLACKRLWSALL